ncbi:unnamed protein product [Rhizophagus irregularis]|nr:unnamed protein product [Rhizophagus irregularis]
MFSGILKICLNIVQRIATNRVKIQEPRLVLRQLKQRIALKIQEPRLVLRQIKVSSHLSSNISPVFHQYFTVFHQYFTSISPVFTYVFTCSPIKKSSGKKKKSGVLERCERYEKAMTL